MTTFADAQMIGPLRLDWPFALVGQASNIPPDRCDPPGHDR